MKTLERMVWLPGEEFHSSFAPKECSPEPAPQSGNNMINDSCRHERRRVSTLIATTSRLNTRAFRLSALVCEDCGKTLITDSVQHINLILLALETLEERVSALAERCEAIERAHHYKIAA